MVKCGIIGCGVIAPTHIEGILELPGAQLEALCDLIPERVNAAAEKYHCAKRATDYHELLADPEVQLIHVCTDHASHAQIVADALNAGKHVLCEKPAGHNDADLAKIAEVVKRHPELVSSGIFQHRFVPQNRALRQLIRSGKFGQGLMMNLSFYCQRTAEYYLHDAWRGTLDKEGGGVLINQAIHYLDLLRFFFGEVRRISALCSNQTHKGIIETEDAAAFTLEFDSGIVGTVNAINSSVTLWHNAISFAGTRATIEFCDEKAQFIDSPDETLKREITEALSYEEKGKVIGKSYYGTGHTAQIADVCDAIEKKRAPEITLLDALNTASLVMAVYESGRSGGNAVTVRRY